MTRPVAVSLQQAGLHSTAVLFANGDRGQMEGDHGTPGSLPRVLYHLTPMDTSDFIKEIMKVSVQILISPAGQKPTEEQAVCLIQLLI